MQPYKRGLDRAALLSASTPGLAAPGARRDPRISLKHAVLTCRLPRAGTDTEVPAPRG